jgi:hypothetical protein
MSSVEPNANTSTTGIRTQLGILIDSHMGFGSGNSEDGQEKLEHLARAAMALAFMSIPGEVVSWQSSIYLF